MEVKGIHIILLIVVSLIVLYKLLGTTIPCSEKHGIIQCTGAKSEFF